MKLGIILLLLLIPTTVLAEWTTQDTILEISWQGLHLVDWGQTLDIAKHPNQFNEINPIIGKHPSTSTVNTYMACSAISHALISYILPKKYRPYWQIGSIAVTSSLIYHNYSIGLKINF